LFVFQELKKAISTHSLNIKGTFNHFSSSNMAATVSSAKRKRADPSQLDWTASRRGIERLYLEEDKGLPTVMKLMREKHNFDAS
jgi:hypothetical protein